MRTFLHLDGTGSDGSTIERDTFPPILVESFLKPFTATGDLVLDPFAGFGTTLVVAEQMGRRAIGVEFLEERASSIAQRLGPNAQIVCGDSRRIDELGLPIADFCLTSPPYMCRGDTEDPLQGYTVPGSGYDSYLDGLADIFGRMRSVLKPDARCVVNVSNIDRWDGLTTLAFDVARTVSRVMPLEKEIVVGWTNADRIFGYDHEYCLVFRNR